MCGHLTGHVRKQTADSSQDMEPCNSEPRSAHRDSFRSPWRPVGCPAPSHRSSLWLQGHLQLHSHPEDFVWHPEMFIGRQIMEKNCSNYFLKVTNYEKVVPSDSFSKYFFSSAQIMTSFRSFRPRLATLLAICHILFGFLAYGRFRNRGT